MKTAEIISGIRETIQGKKDLVEEIRYYLLNPMGVTQINRDKYTEYMEGLLIKEISNAEQNRLGITVLHVLASSEIDFSLHSHENQSQTISVVKGRIEDLQNNKVFHRGESFFVAKENPHKLRYYAGSELIIVYMPALKQVKQ